MEVTRSYRFPGLDDIDANGFFRGQRDLSTEGFVRTITGRPNPVDTAAFVAAITDRPNPDRTAMKALVRLLTNDQTPASRAALGAIIFREQYNPNEPRDWRGRWTTGGADGGPSTGGGRLARPASGFSPERSADSYSRDLLYDISRDDGPLRISYDIDRPSTDHGPTSVPAAATPFGAVDLSHFTDGQLKKALKIVQGGLAVAIRVVATGLPPWECGGKQAGNPAEAVDPVLDAFERNKLYTALDLITLIGGAESWALTKPYYAFTKDPPTFWTFWGINEVQRHQRVIDQINAELEKRHPSGK